MPGQAFRLAAFGGRDVNIGVARILRAERQPLAVGRKMRIGGLALEAGQPPCRAARALDDPEVVGIGEGNVRGAHRRGAQQASEGAVGAIGRCLPSGQNEKSQRETTQKDDELRHKAPAGAGSFPSQYNTRFRPRIPLTCNRIDAYNSGRWTPTRSSRLSPTPAAASYSIGCTRTAVRPRANSAPTST